MKVHSYSIDTGMRKTVLLFVFAVSFLLSSPLNKLLTFIIDSINNTHIKQLIDDIDNIGFSLGSISVLALFGVLYYLFSKHLWKLKFLYRFLNVPNLNGEWIGTLKSSYKDDSGENVQLGATLEIRQDWEKITIQSTFGSSHSFSDAAVIRIDSNKGITLLFSYSNENEDIKLSSEGDPGHRGLNELVFKDNTLKGGYFTNRIIPTRGKLFLMKSEEIYEDVTPKQPLHK
jgi:hypothetical protein